MDKFEYIIQVLKVYLENKLFYKLEDLYFIKTTFNLLFPKLYINSELVGYGF